MNDPSGPAAPQRHSVWGRVTDPGGAVVPADVFWVHAEHAGKDSVTLFDVHRVAHADDDGRFWAPDLPVGPCILVPDFQQLHIVDGQVRIAHGTSLTIPTTEDEVALTFPRRRTDYGSIHGVVTDFIDRRPGARLRVELLDAAGNVLREAETGSDGRFAFPFLLTPAKYSLRLSGSRRNLGGVIPADLGANKRFDMTIEQHRHEEGPRATVAVCVQDPLGAPIAQARVRVQIPLLSIAPARTGPDGRAAIGDLPVRPESVLAEAPGFWPSGAMIPRGLLSDPASVVITLERSVQLRVHVRDAATDRPLRHANLHLQHAGGEQGTVGGVLPPPDQPPRDHHDFVVPQGPVTVRAESPGYQRADETLIVTGTDAQPVPVTLRLQRRS